MREEVMWRWTQRAERKGERCEDATSGFDVGETGDGPTNAGARRSFSKRQGAWPRQHLAFSLQDPFQASDLQTCERINVCRFEPLSLLRFVTSATGN